MPNWTKEQKQAIYEKGENILVAAAAGSGKTAVLVERMINKVINEEIDIDKILVVTFTNSAAAEMKERILDALYQKLEENPEDDRLQKQITLLNVASICTIDSFCLEIVKSHFYELENISPNFRIADTSEIELLKQEILEDLFEEKYLKEDKDFAKLITTYTSYRDDTPLKDLLLKIHTFISSSPYPERWLEEKIEMLNLSQKIDRDFSETIWGEILLKELQEEVEDDKIILNEVYQSLSNDQELEAFSQTIASDLEQLTGLQKSLNNWDKSYEIAQNMKFLTWPRKKIESEIKEEAKAIRDEVKDKLFKKLKKILVTTSKQSNQDITDMYEVLVKLKDLLFEFDHLFSKRKKEKNIVDFSDIEHFALKILLKEENGNLVKTEVAKKYTEKFEEIAIDEYQDSNLVQESILTAVSRGNNLFMVGDVKQSIYKFRQAMPDLFLAKYDAYHMPNEIEKKENKYLLNQNKKNQKEDEETQEKGLKGEKIQLFKNFRSRDTVLDFTNLIFQNIMSKKIGDVEYNEKEYLNLGATDYQENQQDLIAEIELIEVAEPTNELEQHKNVDENNLEEKEGLEEKERIEDIELEARYVANKIKKLIKEGYPIFDRKKGAFRKIQYRDIVILLRSTKDKANLYEQEMIKLGMPVFSDSTEQYLDTIEIQTMVSLLKIIDNPIQDIPLVSVLRSPIGNFTDNELVEIRLTDKYCDFYHCMQKAKVNVNPELKHKIDNFLNQLKEWRNEQEYLALDELIWKLYMETGYYHYVSLMPNGELRQANLRILFERAKQYETSSFKGLYQFIQFIEKLQLSSGDLGTAKIIGENDNVIRIMSIHKSKGLEFPVVFLSNSQKQFNMQDIRNDSVLLHQELGIGAKYIDYNAQVQYDTLTREAVKRMLEIENLSEEMRVLYVALTRAKEKLFITGITKKFEEKMQKLEKQVSMYPKENNKINTILVKKAKSYLDWILYVYIYERNSTKPKMKLNIQEKEKLLKKWRKENEIELENKVEIMKTEIINEDDIKKLKEKIEYKYPYTASITIPTKTSVTKLKEIAIEKETLELDIQKQKNSVEEVKKEGIVKAEENVLVENHNRFKENFTKPKFIKEDAKEKLTATEKGTIMHLCLQRINPKKEYNIEEIDKFTKELEQKGIINQKERESINISKILEFTKSQIGKDLKEAKAVYKEKPFYINIPAQEIYTEETIKEKILVQGIIDLYYIDKNDKLVLVDYKTDYITKENKQELIKKYSRQLEIYGKALEEALGKKVDRKYIYSTYIGEIEI